MIGREDRVNRIIRDAEYRSCLEKTAGWEKDRIFCRHDMSHFLDVARLALIENMREGYGISEELIYGAALLHDIGRFRQYEDNTGHELASAAIAPAILDRCGFSDLETGVITEAIKRHRDAASEQREGLTGLLYRADKLSRCCFVCQAEDKCDWSGRQKNRYLRQ